ncbi:hypothetical protein MRX96_011834 [Rhipicephalus microplus]
MSCMWCRHQTCTHHITSLTTPHDILFFFGISFVLRPPTPDYPTRETEGLNKTFYASEYFHGVADGNTSPSKEHQGFAWADIRELQQRFSCKAIPKKKERSLPFGG